MLFKFPDPPLIKPNANAKIGDEVEVKASLSSPGGDFECIFQVKVDKELSEPKRNESSNEVFPNLPIPKKAFENKENELLWSDPSLNWNSTDIVKVITDKEDSELIVQAIIINMDAFVLKDFLSKNKISSEGEIKYTKEKYFLSVYLHSLFLFSIFQKMQTEDDDLKGIELDEFISKMIKPYASFLLYENHHLTKMAFDD